MHMCVFSPDKERWVKEKGIAGDINAGKETREEIRSK